MPSQTQASAQTARLEALRARHASLSYMIESEQGQPSSNDWHLRDLKVKRLRLKEEIEGIRDAS